MQKQNGTPKVERQVTMPPRQQIVPVQSNAMARVEEMVARCQMRNAAIQQMLSAGLADANQVVQQAFSVMDDDVNEVTVRERLVIFLEDM